MNTESVTFRPIGLIHSPHHDPAKTPIQPVFAKGVKGKVILSQDYVDGLKDLDQFSHIYLFYYFNILTNVKLQLKPFLDDHVRGLFATRAPCRPNKIGMSLVRLINIKNKGIRSK